MSFKASAPGSLMLLGEYAVLHGKLALVCAIDKRLTVTLTPRTDQSVNIKTALGHFETDIHHLQSVPPFHFVLATLKSFKSKLKYGCDILIESEFSATVGFASSAAVTAATIAAVCAWLKISISKLQHVRLARKIILGEQGLGSGADVAACVLGGVVSYRMQPLQLKKLPLLPAITVVYSGSKTPTVEAVTQVKNNFSTQPKLFKQLLAAIDSCAVSGVSALRKQNWQRLGHIMNVQQGLMDALGVNTPALNSITEMLRQQPHILGVKISGSGLGDCVVALGTTGRIQLPPHAQLIPVQISDRGVMCEKI